MDSDAVIRIAKKLKGPLFTMIGGIGPYVPALVRDVIYQYVSKNRYELMGGDYDSCRIDFDGEFDDRFVSEPEL